MLNNQRPSFHDQHFIRRGLGLRRAPEFERWLESMGLTDAAGQLIPVDAQHRLLADLSQKLV